MPATTSGTKTATRSAGPHLPAAVLTALMATPVEALTVAQLAQLTDAVNRVSGGHEPSATIGALLT